LVGFWLSPAPKAFGVSPEPDGGYPVLANPNPLNLLTNPGFETGDFTGWTLSGDTGGCSVSTLHPHSGSFSARLGPLGFQTDGFLDQTITTVVGQSYHVDSWLANIGNVTRHLNAFSASFAGVTFYFVVNSPAFPYTDVSANITATSTSSDLHFAFFNRPYHFVAPYWYLDDVSVTPCGSVGSWTEQAPYPIVVSGNAVASQGGNVYSFGGIANNTAIANAYNYTPATNTWTPIASLPAPRGWFSATSDSTYIYLLGGVDQNFTTMATLWRYDPASDTYNTSLPSYTIPTYFHASVYLNGKIYRIAGRAIGTDYHVEVYDIATNSWAMVANYPVANHPMTVIEITPHRWGWKAFEAPGVEPVFRKKHQAIDYAETRACFRSGEIRILDSGGNVERTIAFNEATRML
jgi:hypothetical protein